MSLLKSKSPRRKNDAYPTPKYLASWVVNKCISLHISKDGQQTTFCEPGCGDFAPFLDRADHHGLATKGFELSKPPDNPIPNVEYNTDFLTKDFGNTTFDIIATNPPFKHGLEFWQRSMDILSPDGVLAFVTKTAFLASVKRSTVWQQRPPAEVYLLYPRPSFTGDGSTDIAQEYCVSFWPGEGLVAPLKMGRKVSHTFLHWLNLKELSK